MKTLATNDLSDIFRGPDGNIAMVSGSAALRQTCEHVSRTRLIELPYAQSRGIPFFDIALGMAPDAGLYDLYLRRALLTVPGVTGVGAINVSVEGGELHYTAEITTIYGTENASGNL
ncbi:hypothetical protein [Franconibacter daqui]|uniref:hypothetical protein n=1 Tax=Franconibacter daqui TaxID=2047724 RepID=UPI002DBEEC35|nr:hypothetical protein [Franconibacter daqui]MEB5921430.1 hypothetical protein [Franconibacter daqui]